MSALRVEPVLRRRARRGSVRGVALLTLALLLAMASIAAPEGGRVLIAYFSLWGNAEYPDNVDATSSASILAGERRLGTTEHIARMIQRNVGGDLHPIRTRQPYPTDFQTVIDQNHREMQAGFLPELLEDNLDVSRYDRVFIGYPVWASEVPQAVRSFLKAHDLSGKKVIPFCTHDGYGAGRSYQTVARASGGAMLEGIAIEAKDVPSAEGVVARWLRRIGLAKAEGAETPIKIVVGSAALEGVIYDTALAKEIMERFPLTVSMVGYGGREYYGGLDFTPTPQNVEGGQLRFRDGDITYCDTNNTLAIFYAQTDRPNLTMKVIPIGRVTSDLSAFETLGASETVVFSLAR